MADYLIQGEVLTGIADKIRVLTNTNGIMTPAEMATNLNSLPRIITSTVEVEDGAPSEYPENSLYIVYEEA